MMKKMTSNYQNLLTIAETINGDHAYYGTDPLRYIHAAEGEFAPDEVKWTSWQFQLPDNRLSITAIAIALGHGMSDLSVGDTDSDCYANLGVTFKDGEARYSQPVLFLSPNTVGERLIWGALKDRSYEGYLMMDDAEEWSADVFRLQPGMPSGGIAVQSASSGATVCAEKEGETWTVTLTMAVLPSGRKVGRIYESAFRGAYNWYHKQAQVAVC